MNELPGWFSGASTALALAVGAALAGFWHGVWPLAAPNLLLFSLVCGAAAFAGVNDTFRAMTVRPMDPTLAAAEILVGGVGTFFLLHHRFLPFVIAAVLVIGVRANSGRLTALVVDLYDKGSVVAARATRQSFTGMVLLLELLLVICGLGSTFETSLSLWHWGFGPIALVAGASGLVLISGANYEVMRTRFRGGEVTSDESFGTGWWGPAAGLIASVLIIGAVVAPPPAIISLRQVSHAIYQFSSRTIVPTSEASTGAAKSSSASSTGILGTHLTPSRIGAFFFVALILFFLVMMVIRFFRYSKQAGQDAFFVVMEYWRKFRALAVSSSGFFVGIYQLILLGIKEGDWRGLVRMLRLWLSWLLELFSLDFWRNAWSHLNIRTFSHKVGASYAAEAGPRTWAGAAWTLAPGDPRRRIREIYRKFLTEAKDIGMGRRPNQTPSTYRRALAKVEPTTAEGLEELTSAYEWARFSQHPVEPRHLELAESGWGRITRVFSVRRERAPAPQKGKGPGTGELARPKEEGRAVTISQPRGRRR